MVVVGTRWYWLVLSGSGWSVAILAQAIFFACATVALAMALVDAFCGFADFEEV